MNTHINLLYTLKVKKKVPKMWNSYRNSYFSRSENWGFVWYW